MDGRKVKWSAALRGRVALIVGAGLKNPRRRTFRKRAKEDQGFVNKGGKSELRAEDKRGNL